MKALILTYLIVGSVVALAQTKSTAVDPLDIVDTSAMSAAPAPLTTAIENIVGRNPEYLETQFKLFTNVLESEGFKFTNQTVLIGEATDDNGDKIDTCGEAGIVSKEDCHPQSFYVRRNYERAGAKWAVAAYGHVGTTRRNKMVGLVVNQAAIICAEDYCLP